ncbi:Cof-type HAD-IIB family hydrolase [uncultured Dubosiella sp.]|uniref:Cof-type HAD-IIB family hydrolase n=1 Tax=uncultured Dubosiella sp. TaxID=1937011 RepID=UPI002585306C|nr:Cof-type HAD-IIB family hydrolase [uncultured Dubosiella sp.]
MKLIASDLDETLLSTDRTVSEENREAIRRARAQGNKFVCATGRGYESIQGTLEEIGMKDAANEYTISFNGGAITENAGNRLIHFEGLPFEQAETIFQRGLKYDVCIHVYTLDTVWIYRIFDGERQYLAGRMAFREFDAENLDFLKEEPLVKVLYVHTNRDYLNRIEAELADITGDLDVSYSSNRYLEFNKKGVNKGNALKFLGDYLGIPHENQIAVGDNFNDLSMIEAAGLGVGVQNTVQSMKGKCDVILKSTNDEGAIAELIDRFVLS